jgi:hypothetical protein
MKLARILRPHHHMQRDGQDGHGWGHGGHRFGQNDTGPGGRMQRSSNDSNQDSQL